MRTLAAILMLLAAPALAQWPSWSRPMEKSFDRGNQALSSAVERLTVSVGPQAWTNYITTNLWASYFSQGSKLKASKNMLKAAVDAGGWVRPATNWTPETSESVTASNLLAWVGAPAGWWTNHPYVNVAGVSNGWRFWPDVASNVVWKAREWGYLGGWTPEVAWSNTTYGYWTGTDTNSLQDAYNAAASGGRTDLGVSSNVAPTGYRLIYLLSDFSFECYENPEWYRVAHTSAYEREMSVYVLHDTPTTERFYSFGDNISTVAYTRLLQEVMPTSVTATAWFSISTNWGQIVAYDADFETADMSTYHGWDPHAQALYIFPAQWVWLAKFNATTNGFKWFR